MDARFEKVLASGRRVVVNLKRKQPEQCTTSPREVKGVSPSSCSKKSKLDGSGTKYSSNAFACGKRLLKYYSNFKNIGSLKRLMFYRNNEWNDFSQDVVAFVNKDLGKKPAVEVDNNGGKILLDFLHMIQLDMETGLHHPIAWIDVAEKCFFPEIVSDSDEAPFNQLTEGPGKPGSEPLETNDINLNLEIEINELGAESSGESNDLVEREGVAARNCDVKVSESCVKAPNVEVQKGFQDQQSKGNKNIAAVRRPGFMLPDVLKEMFVKVTGPSAAEIVEVRPCSSFSMDARREIFLKQIEITKRHRGVANVRYAWLPCSSKVASAIQTFGVGYCEPTKILPVHGNGVHLIPANGTRARINYFDVDENGTQHMVLCRVIMGNMEFVRSGSGQFHPSGEEYDSGVDNLLTPNRYIVWNMNVNSHIYPECIVSFKMTPDLEVPASGNSSVNCVSGVSSSDGEPDGPKFPNSPWMAFDMLFDVVSGRISSDNMNILINYRELFKNKRISRDTFVRMLRVVIGDTLLKVAITSLRAKVPVKTEPAGG